MDQPAFRLVFKGECSLDCEINEAKQKISALLKVDQSKVETLFSGQVVTLKKGMSREEAMRLKTVFDKTGGISYIEQIKEVKAPTVQWDSPSEAIPPQSRAPLSPAFPVAQEPFTCPRCGFELERTTK